MATPFRTLADLVEIRTGELIVVGAAPGAGKSTLATNWAMRSPDSILYVAMDSAKSVQRRLTALALDMRPDEVDTDDAEHWAQVLARREREELVLYEGGLSVPELDQIIMALEEWLCGPLHMVIIDNLYNVHSDKGNYQDPSFYADVLPALQAMAWKRDVAVMVLHHVTRGGEFGKKHGQGTKPLRLTDLLHAGEREAPHVWGMYREWGDKQLCIQILKQRDGVSDPDGNTRTRLDWQPERGTLFSR